MPERYDEWESECGKWIEAINTFCRWTGLPRPDQLERLEEVRISAERPSELEPDELDDDDYRPRPTAFWTIERMFEDL